MRSVVCSFASGEAQLDSSVNKFPSSSEILPHLSGEQLLACLSFCTTLVEEVHKVDVKSLQTYDIRRLVLVL